MSSCVCSEGFKIFCNGLAPEEFARGRMGKIYRDHPIMSRVVATPLAVIFGIIKVLLFPVFIAVGLVALPIIGLKRFFCSKDKPIYPWFQAWGFCLIGLGLTIGFMSLSTFNIPVFYCSLIFMGVISLSITVHVHRALKEPEVQRDKH
jgi:hypothetical protein